MSNIDLLLLRNRRVIEKIPGLRDLASRYLLFKSPLDISALGFGTQYLGSYALISEKRSNHFKRIMQRLERYLGAGPVGPNKYWEYPWVLANLKLEKGMSVLDAGCGRAPLQFLLSDIGCSVVGIDPFENVSWHGIDRGLARRYRTRIKYQLSGIESIGYRDNTFDRVCCVSVIEHCRVKKVENEKIVAQTKEDHRLQRKMMEEMVRVLKPEGLLVVTVDFNIPGDNCILESNVDVANLMSVDGTEMSGQRCPELFPGEKDFDFKHPNDNPDIAVVNYQNTLQTSIGFVLRKNKTIPG